MNIPLFSISLSLLIVSLSQQAFSQQIDSAAAEQDFVVLEDSDNDVIATFKTTRIANGHTVEQVKSGVLDMRINHRFGRISDGAYNFFGLDNAVTRIGFDYGIWDNLMIGIGRSTLNKEFDAFVKYKVLGQKKGKIPVTVNYLAGAYLVSEKYDIEDLALPNRLTYLHQLLIARKFGENLSLQLMPTLVHFNMTERTAEKNTIGAAGIGGRYKLSKRMAVTAEYYYVPDNLRRASNFNPLTLGLDIETGGHVFQLFFSNTTGVSERSLFTSTQSQWGKGELHFGFNISRVFTLHSKSR